MRATITEVPRERFPAGGYGDMLYQLILIVKACEECNTNPPGHVIGYDIMGSPDHVVVCEDCVEVAMAKVKVGLRGSSVPSLDGAGKAMTISGGLHNSSEKI